VRQKPLNSAERLARHRLRRSRGLRCITIELRDVEVEAVLGEGFSSDCDQLVRIKAAIYLILDRHFRFS
jgi:hypothetical protein